MKTFRILITCLALTAGLFGLTSAAMAQSLLSGDVSGKVTDPSGGLVTAATVDLSGLDTGSKQTTQSDSTGVFRFSLLKPGRYTVSVSHAGFQKADKTIAVNVGQVVTADVVLAVGQTSQTIDVTASEPVLSSSPSTTTSFTPLEVELLPNAGGDLSANAFTAPGVVVNSMGGYGNFTVNGLPATSNLFTVNGENDMDPYFNINNSGATNLTLGQNEMQEATVIANPYGGQYGQLSGAQVILVTKSGTNALHGNLQYWWNGRAMNANNWFNNYYGDPKPFSNANQWAGSIGGPIRKNKTFFFVDYEGMRFVLPNVISVTIPTAAFSAAVLANVTAKQPNEAATYKTLLGLWANAPGAAGAVPIANSSACKSIVLPGYNPATPCAARFQATPTALASEGVLPFKIDQMFGDHDTAFFRYRADRGTQPTYLDPISPNFNALSKQPAWDTQFSETHVFSPRATNQFVMSLSHYVAQFAQDPSLVGSTLPYRIVTASPIPFTGFNPQSSFPQGRNVTQYQFIDDFTMVKGRNTFKFGENFRRYDVSDHNFFYNNPAVYFGAGRSTDLQDFANGVAYQYRKSLNLSNDVPIALWGIGMYAHDDIKIASNFTLTLGLRFEHNSNPVCQTNCFSNFKTTWSSLASVTSTNPGSVPYSADFNYGQHQAYQGTDKVNVAPSFGFSYSPSKSGKTVLSGGFGLFYDNAPAGLVDDLLANPPVSVAIRVRPAAGTLAFDPAGGAATWQASANAFNINQTFSQLSATLKGLGSVFTAPSVTGIIGTVHSPRVEEFNFQVQQQMGHSTALTVNFVGNHTENLPFTNSWLNTYDAFGIYPGVKGIPAAPPVANYGTATQVQSGALANYEGLQISVRQQFAKNFSGHFNYTWSHALDEVSNGGIFTYGDSLLGQLSPLSLAALNYGNADYDVRHLFSMDFVYTPTLKTGSKPLNMLIGGWQLASKMTYHTGLPFSILDGNTALGNSTASLLATPNGKSAYTSTSCGAAAATDPCLDAAAFVDSNDPSFTVYKGLSPQTRNQYHAAGFFDLDASVFRNFNLTEKGRLSIGISAFNLFNHPNFGAPDNFIGDSTYGTVSGMVGTPTSPYGNFLGFDSSPRVIQLTGKIVF